MKIFNGTTCKLNISGKSYYLIKSNQNLSPKFFENMSSKTYRANFVFRALQVIIFKYISSLALKYMSNTNKIWL